ncbi:MAG: TOBE domain-containing protein [Gammaproteobacteria bacterium]
MPARAQVVAAIRPEDIVPQAGDAASAGAPRDGNMLDCMVTDMEFLGSFWRLTMRSDALGDAPLCADLSSNAMRRVNAAAGKMLTIELPAQRILVFRAA